MPKIEALKVHIAQIRADLRTWDEKFVGELEKCLRVIVSCPPSKHPRAALRAACALQHRTGAPHGKDACFCVEGTFFLLDRAYFK